MAEEQAKAQTDSGAAAGGGQKPTLFIILAIVNMLIVAGVAFFVFQGNKKREGQPTLDDVVRGEKQAQDEKAQTDEVVMGQLVPMETFLVNLAGSRGRKLAKINMELEVEGENVSEEIDKRKPQIRDIIIILLSSKTYSQVSTKDGKDFLRDEIRDTVNAFLTKGKIKGVYFTEFVSN